MTVIKKLVLSAGFAGLVKACRMRRERLSGLPTRTDCRHDKTRMRRITHERLVRHERLIRLKTLNPQNALPR